jgi:hypothetical protein
LLVYPTREGLFALAGRVPALETMTRRFATLGILMAYLWPATGAALVSHLSGGQHAAVAGVHVHAERSTDHDSHKDQHDSEACWVCAQLGVFKKAAGIPAASNLAGITEVCWSQLFLPADDVVQPIGIDCHAPRAPPFHAV